MNEPHEVAERIASQLFDVRTELTQYLAANQNVTYAELDEAAEHLRRAAETLGSYVIVSRAEGPGS